MEKVARGKYYTFLCKSSLLMILGLSISQAVPTLAAINQQIDFYGTLQNQSGVNLAGTYDMVFRFYDAASGGTLLGTDTHTSGNGNPITVVNGKFAVVLGSGAGNSLSGIDFNNAAIYVGLTIANDSEMVPRERLAAAPYAFNADRLEGYQAVDLLRYNATGSMTATTSDSLLTLTQHGIGKILSLFGGASEVVSVLSNGHVGIGTTTPLQNFVVNGNMALTGGLYDASSSVGTNGSVLQSDGTGLHWVATSTLGLSGGAGTVSSVALSAPTGFSVSGSPITTTGTLSLSYAAGYEGLLSASSTNWNSFYSNPSTRITAGSGLSWSLNTLSLNTAGDWSGTFDGQEGSYYLDRNNQTGTQSTTTITGVFSLASGGTGATTASGARTNLGATTVGTNIFTLANPSTTTLLRINADNSVSSVATSTLGIALSDTTGTLSFSRLANFGGANTILYTSGIDVLSTSSSFTFNGATLGAPNASLTGTLAVAGTSTFSGSTTVSDIILTSRVYDSTNSSGVNGYVLQNTGTSTIWVATSTLGMSGGGGGSLFTDGGATTYLTAFGDNLAIGSTSATDRLSIAGNITIDGDFGFSVNGQRYFYASSTNETVSIGLEAGLFDTNWDNINIGYRAGYNNTGTTNTHIGFNAGHDNTGNGNVILGYGAGYFNTAYGNIILGELAGEHNSSDSNILIGNSAGQNNSNFSNIFIGESAGQNNTNNSNYAIGIAAGMNNTGTVNSIFGYNAGVNNSGNDNLILGGIAGHDNQGNNNLLFGTQAGLDNRGSYNNLIGESAGYSNRGSYNNQFGYAAGWNNNGSYNDIIGYQAGANLQATNTVAIGANALSGGVLLQDGSGNFQALNNVAVGYRAGYTAQTGADNNILIGYQAADNITTGKNNIVLGYDLDLRSSTQSNTLTIGNLLFATGLTATGTATSTGKFGIGTSSPTAQLTTVGTVRFAAFGAGTLQTDASGNLSVSSDERLKDIQGEFTKGLEVIAAIDPIQYKWKVSTGYDTANIYTGFSAQNVQAALPEAVGTSSDGFLSLSDRPILATVVNAIKEIYAWMHTSDTRIQELETKLQTMQTEIDSLKSETVPASGQTSGGQVPTDQVASTTPDTVTASSTDSIILEQVPVDANSDADNSPVVLPQNVTSGP